MQGPAWMPPTGMCESKCDGKLKATSDLTTMCTDMTCMPPTGTCESKSDVKLRLSYYRATVDLTAVCIERQSWMQPTGTCESWCDDKYSVLLHV